MPYFVLIIVYCHVKIVCYQQHCLQHMCNTNSQFLVSFVLKIFSNRIWLNAKVNMALIDNAFAKGTLVLCKNQ